MNDGAHTNPDSEEKVPRLKASADPTKLPLGPAGGFVLSRIDGVSTAQDLADSTGVSMEEVRETLRILNENGLLDWVEVANKKQEKRGRKHSAKNFRGAAARAESVKAMPSPPGTPRRLYDPQELGEPGVEIELETRRQILDTYYRLGSANLYEILGVETDAPKTEIRSAYFRLSKVFHPDTLYGKELGTYKAKMEAVFKRLTEAYEILGKKKRRAEYDDYLQIKNRTQEAEKSVDRANREAERIQRETDAQELADGASGSGTTSSDRASARPPSKGAGPAEMPHSSGEGGTGTVTGRREILPTEGPARAMTDEARARAKRLMAQKLSAAVNKRKPGQSPSSKAPRPSSTPMDRDAVFRGLAGSLRQAASHTGGIDRATLQLQEARDAEGQGNLLAALNALRLAVAISSQRADVAAEYDRVRGLYAAEMADTFRKQAKYEAQLGQWAEAALSWSKVCEGRPEDGHAHVQAALSLVEAKGDMTQAKRFAERGKTLLGDDNVVAQRVLGRIYYALDMKLSAKRAFEAVLKSDPDDKDIKELLKEL